LIEKKNILLLFILDLRHHDFSSKCVYGEKIYFSLFLSQKSGADDFYNNNLLFVYLVTLYSINLHHINVALSAPLFLMRELKIRTHRSRKYRKIMHVKHNQTTHTHPFEKKTLLLFVNVKQENYDSKQVKIIGYSVLNISCFP
jgi:predicted nucleic acid-binding protein